MYIVNRDEQSDSIEVTSDFIIKTEVAVTATDELP